MSFYSLMQAIVLGSLLAAGQLSDQGEDAHHFSSFDPAGTTAASHAAGTDFDHRIALHNVHVFDGKRFLPPSTVIIDGSLIGTDATNAEHIDGKGQFLLPGLIDTHCHPNTIDDLRQLVSFGVTTAFSQSLFSTQERDSLLNHTGLTDLRFPGYPAAAPNSPHSHIPGFSPIGLISSPQEVPAYMEAVIESGGDWVKLLAENPGVPTLSQETLNALVEAAHSHGKFTVCHAAAYESSSMALEAGVDQVHHAPLDEPHNITTISKFLAKAVLSCPTLVMMKAIVDKNPELHYSYAAAAQSVKTLYEAGVPIMGGSDSSSGVGVPGHVPFGQGLHLELELLVQAGLSELDALLSVTKLPAKYYGLKDRGFIKKGMRADLLLLANNPLHNISAINSISRIFVAGLEHAVNTTAPALTPEELEMQNLPTAVKRSTPESPKSEL